MHLEDFIRAAAAHNASKYGGKANPGSVIGKILQERPEAKADLKQLQPTIQKIIAEVNALGVDAQLALVEKLAPEMLEKKEHERDIFSALRMQEGTTVVSGFPPEPSKYPHIGHAKAILINYTLAQKFNGRFVMRFDDTNPDLAKEEFYNIHLENYAWLGVKWDTLEYASDHMEDFYALCEKFLAEDHAYVCTCDGDSISKMRYDMTACACRSLSMDEHKARWKQMRTAKEGTMIVRMKIDMAHKNTTMRDPTMFRIVDIPHVRTGTKYRIWPTYDFETSMMDGYMGITHRIRTKEFELRTELHHLVQRWCGYPETFYYEMGRFNMTGVESSGRIIREKIAQREFVGWDDPRLTTLVALRRRGFHPEAIKNFVLSTGITKNEATLTWDDLIVHNKKYLEENSFRFFFVQDPQHTHIQDAPTLHCELNLHPEKHKGGRKLTSHTEFLLDGKDTALLEEGKVHRLMDCLNFTLKDGKYHFHSTDFVQFRGKCGKILHWLPEKGQIPVRIRMDDGSYKQGMAEQGITTLKVGDHIQFERFGFCRLDEISSEGYIFWYTHN